MAFLSVFLLPNTPPHSAFLSRFSLELLMPLLTIKQLLFLKKQNNFRKRDKNKVEKKKKEKKQKTATSRKCRGGELGTMCLFLAVRASFAEISDKMGPLQSHSWFTCTGAGCTPGDPPWKQKPPWPLYPHENAEKWQQGQSECIFPPGEEKLLGTPYGSLSVPM